MSFLIPSQSTRAAWKDTDKPQFLDIARRFIEHCDPKQIRFAKHQCKAKRIVPLLHRHVAEYFFCLVAKLCNIFAGLEAANGNALASLPYLATAVYKFRPGENCLTSIHTLYVKNCLLAKHYNMAWRVLQT